MDIKHIYNRFLETTGICTDTRKLERGATFVALKGENFDANDFVDVALEGGVSLVICENQNYLDHPKVVVVEDSLKSLQFLATYHRQSIDIRIIGLTGSNGKTTTKELVASCLSLKYNVGVTQGNLNNHIGVPLTLLSFDQKMDVGVVEMGANHQKEIASLARIAEPDEGFITNIGKAHLEGFGGIEGVKKGKGELFDYLKEGKGLIFANRDDSNIMEILGDYDRCVFYSDSEIVSDDRVISVQPLLEDEFCALEIRDNDVRYQVRTRLVGQYNYRNILTALVVALHHGVGLNELCTHLENFALDSNRSQKKQVGSVLYYMDAYNANPTSMMSALKAFFGNRSIQNRCLVLGDMKELGNESAEEHRRVVEYLREQNIESDRVFLVGPEFGMFADQYPYCFYEVVDDMLNAWKELQSRPLTVLVKGSRSIQLEKIYSV